MRPSLHSTVMIVEGLTKSIKMRHDSRYPREGFEPRTSEHNVGFEDLTAMVMKSSIFWDITSWSFLRVNQQFGRTRRLHLQDRRICEARNQHEADTSTGI
jgi:hypothetical protein